MMASEELCKFYRGGHCKFGEKCEKSHRIETCDSFPCLKENCSKRHPPLCRFFSRFGRCKFKLECSYLHVINNFKALETEIDNLQKEVNHLKAENETLKLLMVRLSNLENEVNLMKTSPCEKCDEKSTSASELEEHMVSNHEQILTDVFKCELCEYSSKSKKGVKIHTKTKHKDKNKTTAMSPPENAPVNCTLAEEAHTTISKEPQPSTKCEKCKYPTSSSKDAPPSLECFFCNCHWHEKCIRVTNQQLEMPNPWKCRTCKLARENWDDIAGRWKTSFSAYAAEIDSKYSCS